MPIALPQTPMATSRLAQPTPCPKGLLLHFNGHPAPGSYQVIWAKRPMQTELGRCLAIRLLDMPGGPCLQVMVASPHRSTTWFDADKALTPRQADAWARLGF